MSIDEDVESAYIEEMQLVCCAAYAACKQLSILSASVRVHTTRLVILSYENIALVIRYWHRVILEASSWVRHL